MKKILVSLIAIFILSAFTTIVVPMYQIKLGYTCGAAMPVAIDSVQARFTGQMFNYRITYCSTLFGTSDRYVKFKLMFVDKGGNILGETASGPMLNKNSKLSGDHTSSVPLTTEPYDCIISWWYKDVSVPDKDYTTVTGPDGTVYQERSTERDPQWQLLNTRSLKLFENKK